MSSVDFLEKLLDGVGVKYVPVGSIISRVREKGRNNSDIKTVYSVSNTQGLVKAEDFRDNTIHSEDTSNYTVVRAGMFAYNPARLNIGSIALLKSDSAGLVSPMYVVFSVDKRIVSTEYLGYFIKSSYCANKIQSLTEEGARFRFDFERWDLIDIPIPSLEVQAKIVRMLDVFCNLAVELTAELTARKKQYNYYRDQLLSFEDGEVEWKTLPEMALDFGRGKSKHRPRNDEKLYGGDIPFIQTGDIRSASHIIMQYNQTYSAFGLKQSKLWPKGTLCITIAANIAETSILGFDACFPDSVIGFVADPKKTSTDYVEYLLQSVKNKLEEKGKEKSSAQSNINLATFEQLKLPFPSLPEQARIVSILDKFDALTNSITEGLPREIELRQKQYAHYRDLLLSFPKPEAPTVAQA